MERLFWYLARKLGYGITLTVGKHFNYTEIGTSMPDEIVVYFA